MKFVGLNFLFPIVFLTVASANAADLGNDQQRAAGKELYEKYCVQCHGDKGDGKGIGYLGFKPWPRDFTSGKYKVRSTESGALPTDADIARAIKHGLAFSSSGAYTAMPPWPKLSDEQVMNLVYYLKAFSDDFKDPEYNNPRVVELPAAPAYSEESAKRGRKLYEENECIKCHGTYGRADGPSSPTLKDDWGQYIRPADLTKPWTFRGGSTREDIFRTIATGFNGTPMPSYEESLSVDKRWDLVNYIASLAQSTEPNYSKPDNALVVSAVPAALDFSDIEKAKMQFAKSVPRKIAIVGQVIEPGREFYPGVNEVEVSAVYSADQIGIMLSWHDIRKSVSGTNAPDLDVPVFDPVKLLGQSSSPTESAEDADPFAEAEVSGSDSEDPFAESETAEDDPFAQESDLPSLSNAPSEQYSDAIAIQFPTNKIEGFKKPYFLFGDGKNSVDIWYLNTAEDAAKVYLGKGSGSLSEKKSSLTALADYREGVWTVIFTRDLKADDEVSFAAETFIPFALSVWDGSNDERGNKRGVTSWYSLYLEPMEKKSPYIPMFLYGGGLLLAELLLVGFVRRRATKG